MADRKISDLTALTTPASGDYLPIVDISEAAAASKNKRITIEELFRGVPLGTAAAPSIAIEGDEDTGVFSLGANQLAIGTGGTGRLFITSAGLVGIGTSSPSYTLHVATTGSSHLGASARVDAGSSNQYVDINPNSEDKIFIRNYATAGDSGGIKWFQRNSINTSFRYDRLFVDPDNGLQYYSKNGSDFIGTEDALFTISRGGNVGIGTSSPAQLLHVANTLNTNTSADNAGFLIASSNRNAIVEVRSKSSVDSVISFSDELASSVGEVRYTHTDDSMRFRVNAAERARIDSSGRLLVGTSSNFGSNAICIVRGNSDSSAGPGVLDIKFGATRPATANQTIGVLRFPSISQTTGSNVYAEIRAETDGASSSDSDIPGRLVFSTTADGAASPTERLRIAQNAQLTYNFASDNAFRLVNSTAGGKAGTIQIFNSGAFNTFTNLSFNVGSNGDVTNTNNSYGAISDIKLKENIVDANSQWDDLKALQVRNYNFKEGQTHTQIGLVAQEVELVSPGLVGESIDRDEDGNDLGTVTKSVNYSVLYMKAIKALQEAMERIEVLEQRLNDAGIN